MGTGVTSRWDRTPVQQLEQQVRDLTAQLEQARKATDLATMRDVLSRAGIKFIEYNNGVVDAYSTMDADGLFEWSEKWRRLSFDPATGQLISIE